MIRIIIGTIVALSGAAGLWLGAVPYTETETLELGPITASADVEREYQIPPIAAGTLMSLGVGLAVWGMTSRSK